MARYGNYLGASQGQVGAGATVSTGVLNSETADRVRGTIFSDQAGNLTIEQSWDQNNWDLVTSYAITASAGRGYSEELVAPYVRVRFNNTAGSPTTVFRLYAGFSSAGGRP